MEPAIPTSASRRLTWEPAIPASASRRLNLATCTSDLAACQAAAQAFPATGQTTVHRAGDDGAIQAGATLDYTDNGETITDNNTGLEWEKKSDDELVNDNDNTTFPHDKDNVYTWEEAFAVHVAGLNTAPCFAGFCDWRLPNVKELLSIVNYEVPAPGPTVSAAFNNSCDSGDTVTDGSCTAAFPAASVYWSSTTRADSINPGSAWLVSFRSGNGTPFPKVINLVHVRAVGGGL